MRTIKILRSSALLCLAILLVLSASACNLPSITFHGPVWVTNLPVTFTGKTHAVEHHLSGGKSFTCAVDTTGALTVNEKGGVVFTIQGGTFTVDASGNCVEQAEGQGWRVEGQTELPGQPLLKFTTCNNGRYRAEGSAEYIVAAYQQDTQTSKLTGGITCYDAQNKPIAEFSLYLTATEPRK